MMTTSVMIVYPAISPLTGDRHAPELVIGMAGLGDRHRPDSLIVFTGIRTNRGKEEYHRKIYSIIVIYVILFSFTF
jgi:hypothetical protein